MCFRDLYEKPKDCEADLSGCKSQCLQCLPYLQLGGSAKGKSKQGHSMTSLGTPPTSRFKCKGVWGGGPYFIIAPNKNIIGHIRQHRPQRAKRSFRQHQQQRRQRGAHSSSSTLRKSSQAHTAAGPCSGNSTQARKRTHAALPLLEVRTTIAHAFLKNNTKSAPEYLV